MESFGQRVRRLRHLGVMTQVDLAERAGISPVTVARLETDDGEIRPRPTTVRRLAKALEVDPAWLLFGEEGGDQLLKSAA